MQNIIRKCQTETFEVLVAGTAAGSIPQLEDEPFKAAYNYLEKYFRSNFKEN
jgi:hypothetical protein